MKAYAMLFLNLFNHCPVSALRMAAASFCCHPELVEGAAKDIADSLPRLQERTPKKPLKPLSSLST
jgi:hypothetical protein